MRVVTIFLLLMCLGACFLKKKISQPLKPKLITKDSICLEMENIVKSNWTYDSIKKSYTPKKEFWILMYPNEKYRHCFESIDTTQAKKLFGEPTQRWRKGFRYALYPPCRDLCDNCSFMELGHHEGKLVGIGVVAFRGTCN